jgi:integrase
MMRHSYATQAIRTGVPLHRLSRYLGHASLNTTHEFYIHDAIEPGEAVGVWEGTGEGKNPHQACEDGL